MKSKYKLGFLNLALFLLFCCKSSGEIRNDSILLINKTGKSQSVRYYNSLLKGVSIKIENTDSLYLPISDLEVLFCESDTFHTIFLARKNETLEFNQAKSSRVFLFSKNNRKRNDELNFFVELEKKHGPFVFYKRQIKEGKKLTLSSREKIIDSLFDRFSSFLLEYSESIKMREDFFKEINSILTSYKIIYKLNWGIGFFNKEEIFEYYRMQMDSSLRTLKVFDDSRNSYFKIASISVLNLNITSININERFMYAVQNFQNPVKDFLLTRLLIDNFKMLGKRKDTLYSLYKKNCLTQDLIAKVDFLFGKDINIQFSDLNKTVLFDKKNKQITFDSLLQIHSDKLIYTDFWASWCVPCKKEFPFLKKHAKDFKGRVVFINISLDDDIEQWKQAIQANNLQEIGEQYIMYLNFESPFSKKLRIGSIPRYILFFNGEILNHDVLRPSDPQLNNLLMLNIPK